jgi:predicted NBD/HSP70 family sugar kinase
VVYVTVGTGISHTLVIDGRPFPGSRGAALLAALASRFAR